MISYPDINEGNAKKDGSQFVKTRLVESWIIQVVLEALSTPIV